VARVVWTHQALADVRAVREFIARDAPLVAEVLTDRIFGSVDRLEVFPLSGREVPESGRADLREVIVGSYRVVHRVRETDLLEVLTVFHSARLLTSDVIPGELLP
jgi:addiction module RelE/StbE family toxin